MVVRRYQPGDEKKIMKLFKNVFNHNRSYDLWQWKFINTPETTNPFILVYEEKGEILGHISLLVHSAYIKGEVTKIGLRVDTMVEPTARGKGIYELLNKELIIEAKRMDISFLYGFPAKKAMDLFIKHTDATHMIDMPRLVYIINPFKIAATKFPWLKFAAFLNPIYKKFRRNRKYIEAKEIKEVFNCDQEFDLFAEKTKHFYDAQLVRNADFLNWRYFSHPENTYRMFGYYIKGMLKGYIVYAIEKNTSNDLSIGLLLDIIVDDVNDTEITASLLQIAMKNMNHVDLIQTWSLPHVNNTKILKSAGFIQKDSPVPLVGKEITSKYKLLTNYSMWYISLGDVDSF